MAKKVIKKKKLKLSSFLLVLCVLIGLVFCAFLILMIPVKNILVLNNNYLNDDYILSLGEIRDYPKFFLTRSSKVESNIRKSKYIKKVKLNNFILVFLTTFFAITTPNLQILVLFSYLFHSFLILCHVLNLLNILYHYF